MLEHRRQQTNKQTKNERKRKEKKKKDGKKCTQNEMKNRGFSSNSQFSPLSYHCVAV